MQSTIRLNQNMNTKTWVKATNRCGSYKMTNHFCAIIASARKSVGFVSRDFALLPFSTMCTSKAIRSATAALLFAFAAAENLLGDTTECKVAQFGQPPICCHVSANWNGKRVVKTVLFTGYPRTPQNYVTNFYNILGLPGQDQIESKNGGPYEITGSPVISVQACRKLGVFRRSLCTNWVQFKVY